MIVDGIRPQNKSENNLPSNQLITPETPNKPKDPNPTPPIETGVPFVNAFPADAHKEVSTGTNMTKFIFVLFLVIFLLGIGFLAGWMIYKYRTYFSKALTYSADVTSDFDAAETVVAPKNNNVTPSDPSSWPTYKNATYKYSLKYPDNWYSKGTESSISESVSFGNFNLEKSNSDGHKVDITLQSANGKTLKDWVAANSVVMGKTGSSPTALTLNSLEVYQQTVTNNTKSLRTYILDGNYIITISYSGPEATYTQGSEIYNNILKTITLSS